MRYHNSGPYRIGANSLRLLAQAFKFGFGIRDRGHTAKDDTRFDVGSTPNRAPNIRAGELPYVPAFIGLLPRLTAKRLFFPFDAKLRQTLLTRQHRRFTKAFDKHESERLL